MDLEEHVIQADKDLGCDQDDDGPLQGVALLVLHQLQEVLQVLLHQLQLVLDRVEARLRSSAEGGQGARKGSKRPAQNRD